MTRELTGQPRTWPYFHSLLPSPVRASPPLQRWLPHAGRCGGGAAPAVSRPPPALHNELLLCPTHSLVL